MMDSAIRSKPGILPANKDPAIAMGFGHANQLPYPFKKPQQCPALRAAFFNAEVTCG
jgi:hypothetical protein